MPLGDLPAGPLDTYGLDCLSTLIANSSRIDQDEGDAPKRDRSLENVTRGSGYVGYNRRIVRQQCIEERRLSCIWGTGQYNPNTIAQTLRFGSRSHLSNFARKFRHLRGEIIGERRNIVFVRKVDHRLDRGGQHKNPAAPFIDPTRDGSTRRLHGTATLQFGFS